VYAAKTRYRQPDAPCEIDAISKDEMTVNSVKNNGLSRLDKAPWCTKAMFA
jgi:hypothetical protein